MTKKSWAIIGSICIIVLAMLFGLQKCSTKDLNVDVKNTKKIQNANNHAIDTLERAVAKFEQNIIRAQVRSKANRKRIIYNDDLHELQIAVDSVFNYPRSSLDP